MVLILMFVVPALADYEYGKTISVLSADRNVVVDVGVTPIEKIDFSIRWHIQYATTSDSGSNWEIEESFVGPSVRIPLCNPLHALGTAIEPYVSGATLWHLESKDDLYTPLGLGLDIDLAHRLNAMVELQYCEQDALYRGKDEWMIFGGLKWEFN